MTIWLPDRSALRRPVYLSLADQFKQAIDRGDLAPGARLPTHRALADRLRISVQTVGRAYEELVRLGFIVGEVGRGTFVRESSNERAPPFIAERPDGELIDLSMLKPVALPIQAQRLKETLQALSEDVDTRLLQSFRPNAVLRPHREIALDWLRRCGIETRANNVLICNGATPAMACALMTAIRPGDAVATEAVGHHTLIPLVSYLGGQLVGIPIDEEGLRPDALEAACHDHKLRALFVVPTVANPTVSIMSERRRKKLVEVARRHDLIIVENDAWGPLVEERPSPLAQIAPERTFFLTSFTKCVLPALRIGYLVMPDHLIAAAANRHLVVDWMASALLSEIVARWIEGGIAWDLLLRQRKSLRERHQICKASLAGLAFRSHPESLHIWLPLPAAWREDQFVSHARLHGVALAPGASFATTSQPQPPAVRLCLGGVEPSDLRDGLEVISRLLRSAPEPALLTI